MESLLWAAKDGEITLSTAVDLLQLGEQREVKDFREISLNDARRQVYRSLVAQWVYPAVTGFEVEHFEGSSKDRGLAALIIPPQPQDSHPFLVQGVISHGEVLGTHVLLPVRREDENGAMDAGAIHVRIRLGEQVISGRWQSDRKAIGA